MSRYRYPWRVQNEPGRSERTMREHVGPDCVPDAQVRFVVEMQLHNSETNARFREGVRVFALCQREVAS